MIKAFPPLRAGLILASLSLTVTLTGCQSTPEIQADSRWQQGRLDNGLTYHLYHKAGQPLEIRMLVHAGALQETEKQYGYAHFLEHMAFNGTRNFEGTEIVSTFEQQGMSFGADLNAFTSHEVTSYSLSLPESANLETALTWLRDVGDGIAFNLTEIEKEKGVVLGELRVSESNEPSVSAQAFDIALGDSVYLTYRVLGNQQSIEQMNPDELRAFYQAWYRPNNTELVVVGDFEHDQMAVQIRQHFSGWQSATLPEKVAVPPVKVWNDGPLLLDTPQGGESSTAVFYHLRTLDKHDLDSQRQGMWISLVNTLISNRLQSRAFEQDIPVNSIAADFYTVYEQQYGLVYSDFIEQDREKVQPFMAAELASIRDHGFTRSELKTALSGFISERDDIDLAETNTTSRSIADYRLNTLIDDEPYQAIADYHRNLSTFIDGASVEKASQIAGEWLGSKPRKMVYAMPGIKDLDREKRTLQLWDLNLPFVRAFEAPGESVLVTNTPEGFVAPARKGEVVDSQQLSNGIYHWTLDNGVQAWHLPFEKAENDVYVAYAALGGMKSLDAEDNPAAQISAEVFTRSGLGEFDAAELDRYLKEHNVALYPAIVSGSHGIEMSASNRSLPEAFAALYTAATSMKVNSRQLELVKESSVSNARQALESPETKMAVASRHALYNADSYYQWAGPEQTEQVTAAQLDAIYHQLFREKNDFHLVVVGNIEPKELEPYLRDYVASIDYLPRQQHQPQVGAVNPEVSDLRMDISNENHVLLSQLYVSGYQPKTTRELLEVNLIQHILNSRYRNVLREDHSLDYTPQLGVVTEDGADLSAVAISLTLNPKDVDRAKQALEEVRQSLEKGFSQKELETAKAQVSADLKNMRDYPVQQLGWLIRVSLYGYDHAALENPQSYLDQIGTAELQRVYQALCGNDATPFTAELWPKKS